MPGPPAAPARALGAGAGAGTWLGGAVGAGDDAVRDLGGTLFLGRAYPKREKRTNIQGGQL